MRLLFRTRRESLSRTLRCASRCGADLEWRWAAATTRRVGPNFLGRPLVPVGGLEGGPRHRRARDCDPVAPGGVQALLEAEKSVQTPGTPRARPSGREADPEDVAGERDLGAPRIRNELAKLGIELAVSTVAKYMPRRRRPPSPTWRAFLENHLRDLVALDFFVVPTATFGVLFGLVVLAHHRRRVVHFNREFEERDLGDDIAAAGTARMIRPKRATMPTSIVLERDLVEKLRKKGSKRVIRRC